MANTLIYPVINPLQMFIPNLSRDLRYNSKDFDDFNFPDTILPWQQVVNYKQPWQKNDTIQIQLQTNVGPVNFILKTCDGAIVDTIQFVQKLASDNNPSLFIYEATVPLTNYQEGFYYVQIEFGLDPVVFTLRSGLLDIKILHKNTLLLEYKHFKFREDMIFETGFYPSVRVRATNKFDRPQNRATTYEDQILNESILRAQKFRLWNLIIGGASGIPDYMADMLGGVIACSDFKIDGKPYTLPSDQQMEPNGIDNFPMRGWKVQLRERYTRGGRVYEDNTPMDAQVAVAVSVDMKGLGNSVSGSETAVIDVT